MKTPTLKTILLLLASLAFFYDSSQTITTIAGNGTAAFAGDGGQAVLASLKNPGDICFDANANMYIADQGNHRVRKVTPSGIISTFAGTGSAGYSGDGGQAASAQLNLPRWLYFDNASGNLYISEFGNSVIRKVNALGVISTVAGTGVPPGGQMTFGGQATSTPIDSPSDVLIGPDKKLYFGVWNASYSRVIVVDTLGILSIFAGQDTPLNGPNVIKTTLFNPRGLMFDPAGNLYICDGDSYTIKKINTSGVSSIFAGNGLIAAPLSGDGGQATSAGIDMPTGIVIDAAGIVYFGSAGCTIRSVNTSGIINAFAGIPGGPPNLGDGGPASLASICPSGMVLGPDGNIYIAEFGTHQRVRKIGLTSMNIGINETGKMPKAFGLFPNPANSVLNFTSADMGGKALTIEITDIIGKQVLLTQTNNLNTLQVNINALKPGVYYTTVTADGNRITEKFIKE